MDYVTTVMVEVDCRWETGPGVDAIGFLLFNIIPFEFVRRLLQHAFVLM